MASVALRPITPQAGFFRPDLHSDRQMIELELRSILPTAASSPVSACMEYAVLGDGQRLRSILAIRTAALCGADLTLSLRAAAAIEILHCASLIVDDLPCMDDDATRRNRPSAHVAYGQSTALLTAFGLVALAARTVVEHEAPEEYWVAQRRFQISLLRTLDCAGLIGGQVMDLELSGDRREQCRDVLNDLKTVPLFLLAIEAGAVYAPRRDDGSGLQASLKQFGRQYGIALQMTDDYLDGELKEFAHLAGHLEVTRECLAPFGAAARPLVELVEYLHVRAQDHRHR